MKAIMQAAAILLTFCCASYAQDQASRKFLAEAIEGHLSEIKMGELAQTNGQSGVVKTYGEMLQNELGEANRKAIAVARSLGIDTPNGSSAKQKAGLAEMEQMSGPAFDRTFASRMTADRRKDIEAYEQAAGKQDAVGKYATEVLPTLRHQLERAQSLQKDVALGPSAIPWS
jgi:putative membrane protein